MSVSYNKETAEMLVSEMGFNSDEVDMALSHDTEGDVEKIIQKLLSGEYKPPPYTPVPGAEQNSRVIEEDQKSKLYPSVLDVFSSLINRGKAPDINKEPPTAPPLFAGVVDMSDQDVCGAASPSVPDLTSLPPPYEKIEKENKIKDWEENMKVVYLNNQNSEPHEFKPAGFTPIADKHERCPVCFNALVSSEGYAQQQIVSHSGKIFHHSCFTKKHGPKCAYCYFPLAQADKDHELSGKYLVYQQKDYHVECYEKYAGPRCNYCFDVIIEKPSEEFSGNWVVDKNEQFHLECMKKKMYAIWRAKHS